MKYIRVFALKRSGQHAVLNWIPSQTKGSWLFINDFLMHNYSDKGELFLFQDGNKKTIHNISQVFNINLNGCIFNFEDCFLQQGLDFQSKFKNQLSLPEDGYLDLLILRDPFNLLASRLNYKECKMGFDGRRFSAVSTEVVMAWKEQAKETLGETNILKKHQFINFNEWFSSQQYRISLSQKLGLTFSDSGINEVPHFGGGSSFDRYRYDGKAQSMNVLMRYKSCLRKFDSLIDQDVHRLSKLIFGNILGHPTKLCD